ncbi:MAG: hypothetical protein IT581_21840 [Verrucomicrobiales bacterium]|nr:hypothetical protein [Verrucomicrobiales bacterium]
MNVHAQRPPNAGSSPRRWIAAIAWLAVLALGLIQWRTISHLRQQKELLRSHPAPATAPGPTENPNTAAVDARQPKELALADSLELRRLRDEVQQLREQAAKLASAPSNNERLAQTASKASITNSPLLEESRRLTQALAKNETGAVDALAELLAQSSKQDSVLHGQVIDEVRAGFESLGRLAGQGDTVGLQSLWKASRNPQLEGLAVMALGEAAGMGNQEALKPLLDPESYLILRSTATAALKPAADAGNERAIQALAATASDPGQRALWFLAAQGLEAAAAAGHTLAIDQLAALAGMPDQDFNVRKTAVLALEAASRKHQPRAEEALRRLGWR